MKYKAYKYRLYPTKEQEVLIAKHFGSCRWVYNYALTRKTSAYAENKQYLSPYELMKEVTNLKKQEETSWLKEVNSQALQDAIMNLESAYQKFFKEKKGFPKFKSKNDRQSFHVKQNTVVDFESNRVFIPKFKKGIKCRLHRKYNGEVSSSTIMRNKAGHYYISVLVHLSESQTTPKKPIRESQAVGIDLGVKTFATLSDGTEIPNHKYLKQSLYKLKRLQRKHWKKVKGGNNREKSRIKIARLYEKVTNQRMDFLHKTAHFLVTHYDTLCLETLNVKGMVKNRYLAQAISDVAMGMFNTLLEQKAEQYGTSILRIGRFEPSSKTCSRCGYIKNDLKLSDREWTCPECGTHHNRDLNAAINIKKFALLKDNTVGHTEINACGDMIMSLDKSAQEAHIL